MPSAVIGALRVILGADTAAFSKGLGQAQRELSRAGRSFQKVGGQIATVGAGLSAGITLPLIAMGAAASRSATEAAQAFGQVEAALKSMGAASGRSAEQLKAQASTLQHLSTFDDDDILRKVTANLLTFGAVSGKVFDDAQMAIVNISARMGTDLQAAAIMVGKALNSPADGLASLRRVGIQFTEDQQKQIKAMVAGGNAAGAQAVMLAELNRQFGGSAEALRKATPGADTAEAWRNFQDTLGQIVNNVLPPLTGFLTKVLDGFNNLSPAAQTFAVGAAAVAAALGPVLAGVGGLVSLFGALLPAIGGMVGAEGFVGVLAVLGPVGLAVAAVGAAFYIFRDDLIPILQAFWAQLKAVLGPQVVVLFAAVKDALAAVGEAFAAFSSGPAGQALGQFAALVGKVFGQQLTALLSATVVILTHAFEQIANAVRLVTALLKGDWAGAWAAAKEMALGTMRGVVALLEALVPGATAAMRRLYEGVKTWLVDKFNGIVSSVKAKIDMVKGFFFGLYDAVVGHSYIPDMVEGIASWMGRLDAAMVAPAKAATKKTADYFAALRQDVGSILEGMLSDSEAFALKQQRQLATMLEAAKNPAKTGVTAAVLKDFNLRQYAEKSGRGVEKASTALIDEEDTRKQIERIEQLGVQLGKTAQTVGDAVEDMDDAFGRVRGSLDDVIGGLKDGDWHRAAKGFVDALASIKKAFSKGATTGDKIGGAAGIADAVGQAIGGAAGGALSGAANFGMAAFQMTGNPLIAAGAAVIGGILGAISGGKARKAEKEAARLKQREEELTRARELAAAAAQRLADIEAEHNSLSQRLLEVSGQTDAAKQMSRQLEMNALLDENSRSLQRQISVWEDYNAAVATAAAAVDQARSDLTAAYEGEKSAIEAVRDRFQSFVDGFKAFRQQLEASSATLRGPSSLVSLIGKRLADIMAGVRGGDDKAFEALQSVSEQFLEASQRTAANSLEQRRQLALVRASVEEAESLASNQVDISVLQLDALNAQVAGLISVNDSVVSVAQAIANLQNALAAQLGLAGAAPPAASGLANGDDPWGANGAAFKSEQARGAADAASGAWGAGVQRFWGGNAKDYILHTWETRPDLFMDAYNSAKAAGQPLTSLDAYWQQTRGTAAGFAQRLGLETFATGGSFKVGGRAGIDRNVVSIGASRGEHVNVSKEDVMENQNALLATLIDKVEMLTAAGVQTAVNTGAQRRLMKRWDGDGQPPVRDVA